jgi:hypothetical protein
VFEIGNSLREARTRRQIDVGQAEQATKIRARYLRALEDERFDQLPSQTYVKGFLRTYSDSTASCTSTSSTPASRPATTTTRAPAARRCGPSGGLGDSRRPSS